MTTNSFRGIEHDTDSAYNAIFHFTIKTPTQHGQAVVCRCPILALFSAMSDRNLDDLWFTLFLKGFFRKKQWKPTLILVYAMLAMVAWKDLTVSEELQQIAYQVLGKNTATDFLLGAHKMFGSFFLFGIVPILIVKLIFREKLAEFGLQIGNGRRFWVNTLLLVPPVFIIGMLSSRDVAFWNVYPYNPVVNNTPLLFVCHAMTYLAYYFGWEFFFRGFMQRGLRDSFGIYNAILVQTMASAVLHFGHPMYETFGAIAGGLVWGFLVLRCRSIWSGFVQHSVLGITLDWFILKNRFTE
jgi:membrane protease YdiL (CAAX protease family)